METVDDRVAVNPVEEYQIKFCTSILSVVVETLDRGLRIQ